MGLKHLGFIPLPPHAGQGGFDHAAVDRVRGRLYVAHTANDAVDVIDTRSGSYLGSVPGLPGVAGVLADEASGIAFTSNRRENTLGIFSSDTLNLVGRLSVGHRPNGLAHGPSLESVLSANVGDPSVSGPPSVTLVNTRRFSAVASLVMPGRTRWAVFDDRQGLFFVNIADPSRIVGIDPLEPSRVARSIEIPARGPHGLEIDRRRNRLYCACDEGKLISLDAQSGAILGSLALTGAPDVVFLHPGRSRLYVAIGDPGVIDVIDVAEWRRVETIGTEPGTHTIALDDETNRIYAFLPDSHRASVFEDVGERVLSSS